MSSIGLASHRMVLKSVLSDGFLTRTYLVGDGKGGAFFVDAGGKSAELVEHARAEGITPTHVLLTHHHYDHVSDLAAITEAFPGIEVLIHPSEADLVEGVTGTMDGGETLAAGGL